MPKTAPSDGETTAFAALTETLSRIRNDAAGNAWQDVLGDLDPMAVATRETLAELPVLRKADLTGRQAELPPFGGLNLMKAGGMARLFSSPGPIYEPQGTGEDWFGAADALRAAGAQPGDVVLNTFSYHMTPAGFMFDGGARALDCAVIPAGPAAAEDQIAVIRQYRPSIYVGIPDFLKILLDKLDAAGSENPIERALVTGAALSPSLAEELARRGVAVRQAYGTAELGMVAYEDGGEGMRVCDHVIVEIVKPGTGEPAPEGDVGEMLVTRPDPDYPLIRFATGDMSSWSAGEEPRISGWKGRADQSTKVKGMFVRPEQVGALARQITGAGRLRLVVSRTGERDRMVLKIEHADAGVAEHVAEKLATTTRLRGEVEVVPPGSLPNDGKVIVDERDGSSNTA